MIAIKTSSGFETKANENAADDLIILDLIYDADAGNPRALRALFNKLIGEDETKRLMEHVTTDDGRVPITALRVELIDIINGIGKK